MEFWERGNYSCRGWEKFHEKVKIWVGARVQFSHLVMSDALWPHGPQHSRAPCPSPTPRVYPKSCPLSQWCHLTISSSVIPFSSCPQSFPASGSSQMSQLFAWGGQSIRVSASTSVLPMNIQGWFPLGLTDLISLLPKGLLWVFSSTTVWRHQFFDTQPFLWSNSHIHTWLLENHSFDSTELCHCYLDLHSSDSLIYKSSFFQIFSAFILFTLR